MSHWNYRVMEFADPDGTVWQQIHEVHYDDEGRPYGYTEGAARVCGDDVEEMRVVLEQMSVALAMPVLRESDFPDGGTAM